MWTKENLLKAAQNYRINIEYSTDIDSLDSIYLEDIDTLVEKAFLEGANFILKNQQKD